MLIRNLKVSHLLSFGPTGIDLPMRPLNVLIGANGSGKSNFVEVLSLLKSAPRELSEPIKAMGGVREWLWKDRGRSHEALIEVSVSHPGGQMGLRHILAFGENGMRFEVTDETIENELPYAYSEGDTNPYYRYNRGNPAVRDGIEAERKLPREQVRPEESILSQLKDPERYPELARLQDVYSEIRFFRNWCFGPNASFRREQSTHGRSDFLSDGGENLALVLSKIRNRLGTELLVSMQKLFDGIKNIGFEIDGGNVQMFLEEADGRFIPAARLSDGTLRYLALLAILLHPEPPPLIVIEEPELGLHPDVIPHIAELLQKASARTQLVVTTHSRVLVDALGDDPECVVVCEKHNGQSTFERLDGPRMQDWLERYSLGELWSIGELGGNRW